MQHVYILVKDFTAHQSSGDDELPASTRGKACDIGDVRIELGGPSWIDGVWLKDDSGLEGRDGEKSPLPVGVTLTLRTQVGCVDSPYTHSFERFQRHRWHGRSPEHLVFETRHAVQERYVLFPLVESPWYISPPVA